MAGELDPLGEFTNIPDISPVLLPYVYVPRSYATGRPWPLEEWDFNTSSYAKAVNVFRAVMMAGPGGGGVGPAALPKTGASLTRAEVGHFALGLSMMICAVASGARLPAIPFQWGDVKAAEKVAGHGAQIPADHAMPIIDPWKCGTPSSADAQRKKVLMLSRKVLKAIRGQKLHTTAAVLGTTYTTDSGFGPIPSDSGGVEAVGATTAAIAALPAILLTVATIGAIGISQYFKAEVEKQRLYFDFQNVVPLAGIHAALELELARQRAEIETGKAIAPSPLATKIADGLQERITKLPSAGFDPKPLLIAGGITAGSLGAAWLARKYWLKHNAKAAST